MQIGPRIATPSGKRRLSAALAIAIGVATGAFSERAHAEPPGSARNVPADDAAKAPAQGDEGTAPSAADNAAAPSAPDNAAPREITVRGSRAAPPVRSASQVVRQRDVIAATPHQTASDLLALVPGVYITQHSGEGKAHQIFLRGFDAQHGQDVEISAGGVPVNEVSNVHGQGYADLHFLMPEIVREIDAMPGPFDPRQGDFAVAGSIRMHLGYDEPGITAKGTLGSFGTRRLFLAFHPTGAPPETFVAFDE